MSKDLNKLKELMRQNTVTEDYICQNKLEKDFCLSVNEVSDILNENRMEDQVHQYKEKVLNIVSNQRKKENKLSIIIKVFEKYKNMLNEEEINMFNGLIESYENQRIPFSTLEVVIKMYATRFEDKDILNQTFFYPYPENLINITDSGKGRKL